MITINKDALQGGLQFNPKWYSGDKPTRRDVYGRILNMYEMDPGKAEDFARQFQQLQQDPTSMFFNPYYQPSNRAVSALKDMGFDTSVLSQDWMNANSDWISSNLEYRGNTNTPSAPTKKSSDASRVAYQLYQWGLSEANTQKAEQEIAELKKNVSFMASRKDRNYSDDEILGSIDWSKYPTLNSARNNAALQKPTEFNRALNFSDDDIYGWMWSARNGYEGDNNEYAMAMSALGRGTTWHENKAMRQALDPTSDKYKPYSIGSTELDDAALYFNTPIFDRDWTVKNESMKDSQDETQKKMYQKVWNAEQDTLAAENEYDTLMKWIDSTFANETNYETALKDFEKAYSNGTINYQNTNVRISTLKKMDTSVGYTDGSGTRKPGSGSMISLTRPVDYKYEDVLAYLKDKCAKNAEKKTSQELLNVLKTAPEPHTQTIAWQIGLDGLKSAGITPPAAPENKPKESTLPVEPGLMEAEKPELRTIKGNDQKRIFGGQKGIEEKVVDYGYGSYTVTTLNGEELVPFDGGMQTNRSSNGFGAKLPQNPSLAIPKELPKTPLQMDEEAKNRTLSAVTKALADRMSEKEKQLYGAVPFVNGERLADAYYNAMQGKLGPVNSNATDMNWVVGMAMQQAADADGKYLDTKFSHLSFCQEFESIEKRVADLQAEVDSYYKTAADNRTAGEPLPEEWEITVGGDIRLTLTMDDDGVYRFHQAGNIALGDNIAVQDYLSRSGMTMNDLYAEIKDNQERVNAQAEKMREGTVFVADEDTQAKENQITYYSNWLAERRDEYNGYQDEIRQADAHRAMMSDVTLRNDGLIVDPAVSDNIVSFVSGFYDWERPADGYDSIVQGLRDYYGTAAIPGNGDVTEVQNYVAYLDNEIKDTQFVLDSYGNIPEEYRAKMEDYIDWMGRQKRQYQAYMLFRRDDFDELVDKGKGDYWQRINDLHESTDVNGEDAKEFFFQMTDSEKNIYYALCGLYGVNAADRFYADIESSLVYRTHVNIEENQREMAESGFFGRLFAEAYSIASPLIEVPASVMNMLYAATHGGETNELLALPNAMGKGANEAVMTELKNKYDGTIWGTVIPGLVEMINSRGRSMVTAAGFGGLIPGSDKLPDFLNEAIQAMPMATIALADGYSEAKKNGLEDWQAWTLGVVNFIGESFTEGIKFGHMDEAMSSFSGMSLQSVKDFLKGKVVGLDWLSEATGETVNDFVGHIADIIVAGDKSEYKKQKQQYIDAGLAKTDEEAAGLVWSDYVNQYIHTALISALSSFLDVGTFAVGKIKTNIVYAQELSQLRRIGDGTTTIRDLRNRDVEMVRNFAKRANENKAQDLQTRQAPKAEQQTEQQAEQQAPKAEQKAEQQAPQAPQAEPAIMPEELEQQQVAEAEKKQNDVKYDVNIVSLESAADAEQAATTAALAAVMRTDDANQAQSMAAAAEYAAQTGADAVGELQKLLLGGRASGTNINQLKLGIQYAMLADGECRRVMNSDEYKAGFGSKKARMLADAVLIDSQNADVRSQVDGKIHDNRVLLEEMRLLSEKETAEKVMKADERADESARKVETAKDNLEKQRSAEEAAAQETRDAAAEVEKNASDDNIQRLNEATDRQKRASEVTDEYQKSAENAERDDQTVQADTKRTKDGVMSDVRQIAEANVNQQEAVEREAAAQAAAEAQAVAEQQAKEAAEQQAAEDERTGKTAEDEENAKIDGLVDSFKGIPDERREALRAKLKDRQAAKKAGKTNPNARLTDTEAMLALGAFQRKLNTPIMLSDKLGAADGEYRDGVIYLNQKKAQDGSIRLGQALVEVSLHEITHSLEQTKSYGKYRDTVIAALYGAGDNFNAALYDQHIKQKQDHYAKFGETLSREAAEKEIIADYAKFHLATKDAVQRFMDAGLAGKIRNALHNVNQAMKNFFGNMTGKEREAAENLRRAERMFQKALAEKAATDVHPGSDQLSIAQFAQATGMTYDEEKQTLKDAMGRVVDGVNVKVTRSMIRQTPVGKLIALGLSDDISTDRDGNIRYETRDNGEYVLDENGERIPLTQKTAALDMFTGLMNMIAQLRDKNLVWEIAGSTLESTFSALKSNSDTQYHDTIDFGTICAKTQAIVNVMSEVMMDRLKANKIAKAEGRTEDISYGLTREDVLKIYNETHKAGLSVPCPVCYVFSRWMGVPSLLGSMSRFQHDYVAMETDANGDPVMDENGYAKFDPVKTQQNANDYINEMHRRYGDKDGVDERKTKLTSEIDKKEKKHTKIASEIEQLENKLKDPKLAKRSRDAAEAKLAEKRAELEQNARDTTALDNELREVEAYNWITQALCKRVKVKNEEGKTVEINEKDENGNYKIDPDFHVTPDEVLMDMRRTGEFADRYAKNWAYRTSRGAGMGKSILPYSGASLGDIILGSSTRASADENVLLGDDTEKNRNASMKKINDARDRARRQNLIGGQRLQSTSDFRPEWGLDYVMAFLELQAAKSNAQMYTKVAEAVDLFASAGADVNLSIMGAGNGYHEASAEEIAAMTDEEREASTVGGKVYVMDFSDVTGMRYSDARAKSKQYNNVQMILVGMNDTHIRLAMQSGDIDFIIPWHSSGNSNDVLSQLVSSVEETLETSSDYTKAQSDKFVTQKKRTVDPETGKTKTETVDARTDDQKAMWSARIKILTGIAEKAVDQDNPSKGGLTEEEQRYVFGDKKNDFLADLYDRFYKREGDKCYHVALTASQAKQIFPYEYWQTDVTKDGGTKATADENGWRFVQYCQALGVVPRFSGAYSKKAKSGDAGNFAGAVYNSKGEIVGYDREKMAKGYWKLLIDRKMYGLDGNYREQQTIDTSNINIGGVDETGAISDDSMLPKETSAKYGIPALERQAARASEGIIEKPFDLKEVDDSGQHLYSSDVDMTDAELDDMLRQAGVDYQDAVARGDMEAAQEDSEFIDSVQTSTKQFRNWFKDSKVVDEEGNPRIVYHGTTEDFTEFDMSKGRSTMDIQGSFFSPYEIEAGGYGDKVGAYYLSIQNPASEQVAYAALRRFQGQNEAGKKAKEYLISQGYDGVIYGVGEEAEEYIAFYPEQIKSATDNVGTFDPNNPDIRYSFSNPDDQTTDAELDDMLRQAGVDVGQQAEQAGQVPPGQVPPDQGIPQLNIPKPREGQRQWGANMAQEIDELAEQARSYVLNHNKYMTDSNPAQIDRAVQWAKSLDIPAGQDRYAAVIQNVTGKDFDFRSADGQAKMAVAMGMAVARNDVNAQVQIADAVNKQGTTLGQALQSRKLFRLMTPEGRIGTLQKMLRDQQDELGKKGMTLRDADGNEIELKFSEWVYRAAAAAETAEDFAAVQQAAAAELAQQLPASWKDRLTSLRMLSMLANPRTHIRNIIGNALFVPAVSLKNKIGALGEIATKQGDRTKTLKLASSKEIRDFARADADSIKGVLTGQSKYNEASMVNKEKAPLGSFVKALSDFNSNALEGEDWFFLKGHYRRALGGWMTANGYSVDDVKANPQLLEQGRQYAINEAQKATYRDFSKVAKQLNDVSRQGGVLGFITDAALPFKKTPVNIMKRGVEYSPIGVAKGLYNLARHMKQYTDYQEGKIKVLPDKAVSPAQVIDQIASGLSGTAVMALGYLLAGSGAVSCGFGDDDEDKLEKLKGGQEYAVKFSLFGKDISFTMDWAAPMSMPFFVGAAIREQMENEGPVNISSVLSSMASITEPVFNLSMLDGVNSLFRTSQYDETNQITQIGAKIVTNYVTSYVPSLLGAIARTIDDTRRRSYVTPGEASGVEGTVRYAWENTENKIPGVSQTNIPYRDVFGNPQTSSLAERVLENFILPGYVNKYKDDPVIKEIGRLFDATHNGDVIPVEAKKYINYNTTRYNLGPDEYDTYVTARGQKAYADLMKLIESPTYQNSDADTQIAMMQKIWDRADSYGKSLVIPGYQYKDSGDTVDDVVKATAGEQYLDKMFAGLNGENWDAYATSLQGAKDCGYSDDTIKTKIGNKYRDLYKEYYLESKKTGDTTKMEDLEELLGKTGYTFDFKAWRKQADEKSK